MPGGRATLHQRKGAALGEAATWLYRPGFFLRIFATARKKTCVISASAIIRKSVGTSESDRVAHLPPRPAMSKLQKARDLEAMIRASFNAADSDKSGFLERAEMAPFLSGTPAGAGLDSASVEKLITANLAEFDTDGDGKLDFDEFVSSAAVCCPKLSAVMISPLAPLVSHNHP